MAIALYETAKKNPLTAHIMFSLLEWINSGYRAYYLSKILPIDFPDMHDKTVIISVAFNNPTLVEKQIELIKKFSDEDTVFVVADNSSVQEKRKENEAVCKKTGTLYVGLPKNPRKQPSLNHGIALNWIYANFVRKIKPFSFGFIDHDIFPTGKITAQEILKKYPLYGLRQERALNSKTMWYMWAGYCFFRYDFIKDNRLNFSSVVVSDWHGYCGLDTGGGNWRIFKDITAGDISFAKQTSFQDGSEQLDEWYHIRKSSEKGLERISSKLQEI